VIVDVIVLAEVLNPDGYFRGHRQTLYESSGNMHSLASRI
jgi:hypothetical protein